MNKLFLSLLLFSALIATAQDETLKKSKGKVVNKPQDHFSIGYNFDNWRFHDWNNTGFATKWYSRGIDVQLFYDKPFKKSRLGIGIGAGVNSSNIYHNSTFVSDTDGIHIDSISGFSTSKNYKLNKFSLTWLEVPVELRWRSKPDRYNNCWKVALGIKAGFKVSALQKTTLNTGSEFQVTKTKRFADVLNYRLGPTFRFGYGPVNINMFYSLTNVIKKDRGMKLIPFSVGVSISAF